MLQDAFNSLNDIASPPFRRVVVKSLALTAAALLLAWFGLDRLALHFVDVQPPWLATLIAWLIAIGLLVGAVFLGCAGRLAGRQPVPRRDRRPCRSGDRPARRAGPAGALRRSDAGGAALRRPVADGRNRLAGLLFVPGIGLVAWLAANAYLLGREYFELAAMRFHSAAQARALRRQRAGIVFAYGVLIAVFVAIPLVNLLTPLFATTLMARLHKRVARAG